VIKRRSVGRAWRLAAERLAVAEIEGALRDARLLAEIAFGMNALDLSLNENKPITHGQAAALDALVARRIGGEPVARIAGVKDFYGLTFGLGAATLVPRPETEMLVELGLEAIEGRPHPLVLDLGTGSGCVAISILKHAPEARGVAVDKSSDALHIALQNAARHAVASRLTLLNGDWFSPLAADQRFDLIVSNPPYIPHGEIETLDAEVKLHDPALALNGGGDGFEAYRRIIPAARTWLAPDGVIALEHGAGQSDTVRILLDQAGFAGSVRHDDLAGHDRVTVASRQP